MATKKSLFSKPKWAATSGTTTKAPADDTSLFRHDFAEVARAQRKYEEERKLKKKAEREKARQKSTPASDEDDDQPAKKRRKSSQHDLQDESSAESVDPQRKRIENGSTPSRDAATSAQSQGHSHKAASPVAHAATDSDDDLVILDVQSTPKPKSEAYARPATPDSDSDPDEDPYIKNLKRQARAAAANRAPAADDQIIALRIKTLIPQCEELYVKRKASQPLSHVVKFFIERNKLEPNLAQKVFFTWNHARLYNSTTLNSLLNNIKDKHGTKPDGTSLSNGMIEVEAVTEEIFRTRLAAKERERERARRREMGEEDEEDEEPVEAPVEAKKPEKIVINLKPAPESGLEGMMLRINPDTAIEKIINGYMRKKGVNPNTKIHLVFDGEVLDGEMTAEEVGFENDDAVDVRVSNP